MNFETFESLLKSDSLVDREKNIEAGSLR